MTRGRVHCDWGQGSPRLGAGFAVTGGGVRREWEQGLAGTGGRVRSDRGQGSPWLRAGFVVTTVQ